MFLRRIATKTIMSIADLRFITKKKSKSQYQAQLPPTAPSVIQMTAQFCFNLATNVTITSMSAAFTVLSFVPRALAKWQINSFKNGDYPEKCVWLQRLSSNIVPNYSLTPSTLLKQLHETMTPCGLSKKGDVTHFPQVPFFSMPRSC